MNAFFFVAACVAALFGYLCWCEHRREAQLAEWADGRERAERAAERAALREHAALVRGAQWVGAMKEQLDEIMLLEEREPNRTLNFD